MKWAEMTRAWIWSRTGETKQGIEVLNSLLRLVQAARFGLAMLFCHQYLAEGYLVSGEFEKAEQSLEVFVGLGGSCGARPFLGVAHRLRGELALKTIPSGASDHFDQAISIFIEIKAENELALAYSGMGHCHKQQSDTEQARECLTKALEIFERLRTLIEPDKVRKELGELPE